MRCVTDYAGGQHLYSIMATSYIASIELLCFHYGAPIELSTDSNLVKSPLEVVDFVLRAYEIEAGNSDSMSCSSDIRLISLFRCRKI